MRWRAPYATTRFSVSQIFYSKLMMSLLGVVNNKQDTGKRRLYGRTVPAQDDPSSLRSRRSERDEPDYGSRHEGICHVPLIIEQASRPRTLKHETHVIYWQGQF